LLRLSRPSLFSGGFHSYGTFGTAGAYYRPHPYPLYAGGVGGVGGIGGFGGVGGFGGFGGATGVAGIPGYPLGNGNQRGKHLTQFTFFELYIHFSCFILYLGWWLLPVFFPISQTYIS
jgi:hypothetical protein